MILLYVILFLIILVAAYMQLPRFGAVADGERRQRILHSPNYSDGKFRNRSFTPSLTEGFSITKVMFDFFFKKGKENKPTKPIPSVRTDLHKLPDGDWLIWFGHSSYFMQLNGMRILVDPVFSGNASPIPGTTKAFKGSNEYGVHDMPDIDYLFITHDHYDHLDYDTVKKLRPKIKRVITGLGVGAHLGRWGYPADIITEMDWDTNMELQADVKLFALTARHFSGRSFKRDQTLWLSFLLQTPTHKIYIGGDSGYDHHFREIGDKYGPIDIAVLENGQYNEAWKAIHFLPGENLQAAVDLRAKRIVPVHSAKFSLALHDWNEPLKEIYERNKQFGLQLVTPMIGEPVNLNNEQQSFDVWW